MKSYTDLEQSKKLAEFLPLESADMSYVYDRHLDKLYGDTPYVIDYKVLNENVDIPCWSLAALFNYLREIDFFPEIDADELTVTMSINYVNNHEAKRLTPVQTITIKAENFIDACYEMILKLNERKLL